MFHNRIQLSRERATFLLHFKDKHRKYQKIAFRVSLQQNQEEEVCDYKRIFKNSHSRPTLKNFSSFCAHFLIDERFADEEEEKVENVNGADEFFFTFVCKKNHKLMI